MSPQAGSPLPGPSEVEGAIAEFGQVLRELHVTHADLTARAARMEQELEAKLAELEAIVHDLPTGVIVRDADGAVQRSNPVAQALLGQDEQALHGRINLPLIDRLAPDGTPQTLSDEPGDQRVVALRRSAVTLSDGTPIGTVELLDDRTELDAMTRKVHLQAKMAALGTMAGGIAHEIRNPLNAVRGFASLLLTKVPAGSTEERWARLIEEGVDECDGIVGAVLAFAAPERLTFERLNAQELCEAALAVVQRELERRERQDDYSLSLDAPADLSLDGDRIQLRQALRNLIANAIDVQPSGGLVRIEATSDGAHVELRVHDSGPGIPPDAVGLVTDPFFTTRADGTGLGLALVHTVARLHGGQLEVCPAPGPLGGADMRLVIPIHSATLSLAAGSSSKPASPCDAR